MEMGMKCLVIVPHPDDEIGVAGCVFDQLKGNGVEVTVALCTNGDFVATNADCRIRESLKAKKKLGYDNLVILGYGDNCRDTHIYHAESNEVIMSHAGLTETRNAGGLNTFHFSKYGSQCTYTRNNLKNDIKELILDINAQIIICVDTDFHPDHRAISLLFDEVVGELLKTSTFHSVVLKKFSYVGSYYGYNDYFHFLMRETLPSFEDTVDNKFSYPYNWDDRIQIANTPNNYTLAFWKSSIFKALLKHKSQNIYERFVRLSNADVVFWYRSTLSFSYSAQIDVSSGDPSYLNDFKIIDTDNIKSNTISIEPSITKAWIPLKNDYKKNVNFNFLHKVDISYIVIYQAPFSNISRIDLTTDLNYSESFYFKKQNIIKISIPMQHSVSFLHFSFFSKNLEDEIAIYELEVYKHTPTFPWDNLPFLKFSSVSGIVRNKILSFLCSYFFDFYYRYNMYVIPSFHIFKWRIEYKVNAIFNRIISFIITRN